MGETISGVKQLVGAKRPGGKDHWGNVLGTKRLGEEMVWGRIAQGSLAKQPTIL